MIIAKVRARAMIFDASGQLQGAAPALLGLHAATIPRLASASAGSPVFALMNALHQRAVSSRHGTWMGMARRCYE